MSWLNNCHTLKIIAPPSMVPEYLGADGKLNWLKVQPFLLQFHTSLKTHAFHETEPSGEYDPPRDGDPLTYASTFTDNTKNLVLQQNILNFDCLWRDLPFFTTREMDLTVLASDLEEGELSDEEEEGTVKPESSATASTQQATLAARTSFTLAKQEQPEISDHACMTDFQWECK